LHREGLGHGSPADTRYRSFRQAGRLGDAALGSSGDRALDPPGARLRRLPRPAGRRIRAGLSRPAQDDQGVGAHKDSGFVTILLQDETAGLQVETPGGWIDAPPIPGTFVVNIGELLEMASNGYLKATMHRVISPPTGRERFSVAFFLGASLDATVPLVELPRSLAAEARGVTQDPSNPLFNEVGRNYLKSRLRSHPDVARRHYADVLTAEDLAALPSSGGEY
jgi:hypothetical protein